MIDWENVRRQLTGRFFLNAAIVLLAYVVAGRLGLSIHPLHQYVTLIWPASGIALAAVIVGGYLYVPVIALAAFITNLSVGAPVLIAAAVAIGNMLEALAGAYVLKRFIRFNYLLRKVRDSLWLILVALFATMVAATIGAMTLYTGGVISAAEFGSTWVAWWIGDTLGVLVVTPFLIRWLPRPKFVRTGSQLLEAGIALGILTLLSFIVFWTPYVEIGGIPLFYGLLIPLVWIALRVGPRAMSLALLMNGIIATSGVLYGYSASIAQPTPVTLLPFQLTIGVLSALFLLFTSLEEERKEVTQALRDYVGYLEQAVQKISSEDEAKNEFLAILAHELRNPLAPILSSLELLKLQGVEAEETPALLEIMDDRVRTMGRLLDDLLDVSRITRKKFTMQKEMTDLHVAIRNAVEEVEPFIRSHRHKLKLDVPQYPLTVKADPVRLEQILANLLTNSAKYTEPEGQIDLIVRRDGEYIIITVRDNGIGIPQEMLTRIFEPFLQVPQGRRQTAGLGIGLSLTKHLVEMHGGTIEARSAGPGQGSEFLVRLPVPDQITEEPMETTYQNIAPEAPKFRILVVDDNEAAAQALGRLLEFKGHEVALTYNGKGALKAAVEFEPTVIILDIGLPDIDGYEVAERLRTEIGYDSILIALTGYGQSEDKMKAHTAGFDYHLTKPIGLADVEAALGEVVKKRQMQE